jgi:hypothetical protein
VSGSGSINDAVSLPVGGSVTYLLSGTVDAGATGTLTNTASIATTGGVTDPDTGNNAATDADPVVIPSPDNDTVASAAAMLFGPTYQDSLGPAQSAELVQLQRAGQWRHCVEVDNAERRVRPRHMLSVYHASLRPSRRQRQHRRRARSRAALARLLHSGLDWRREPGK